MNDTVHVAPRGSVNLSDHDRATLARLHQFDATGPDWNDATYIGASGATMTKLWRRGLVERRHNPWWHVYEYAITAAGIAVLDEPHEGDV